MVVSINDVARRAGVAVSTVSKVLNHYPNVSQATKDKVNKAVAELNYVPNTIASALSSKNNKRVALVVFINNQRQAIDEINMQYLFGAFNKAKELSLEVVTIFSSIIEGMNEEELIRYFNSLSISGIIIYGLTNTHEAFLDIIERQLFHIVVVDAPLYNQKTSSVMVDHTKGQYDVAKKCLENIICDRMLYIAGGKEGFVTQMRVKGIERLQEEYGFELAIEYADFSEKKAYQIVLEKGKTYDAIVCASDLMAIGAVHALQELDIFHPVCGYDGITLLGYVGFAINTVKQDFYDVSSVAIEEMQNLLNGDTGKSRLLDYSLCTIDYKDVIM
ncbi:MAG: LacI family DNA-binding transcriptional regulator [Erysipelotrichales bacterium]|nr:LacI family DNA-binding transcriptional regulator [Erysipelotrichales bacterium]